MSLALVTGGTSGIGYAFAKGYAGRGFDVVLVARDESKGKQICQEISSKYGVQADFLQADLSLPDDVKKVCSFIDSSPVPLDVLVNSAGFGLHGGLDKPANRQSYSQAMQVMCMAVMEISVAGTRRMKDQGFGKIINIGSASAWIMQGLYSAIKAWVVRYTQALSIELDGTGVSATVVCPGFVKTQFHSRAGISANLPGAVWIDIDTLTDQAIADAEAGKMVSIPTLKWKMALNVAQHLPTRVIRWMSKKFVASRKKDA